MQSTMTRDEYLDIKIAEREARRKEASGYVLNTDMHIECRLLDAEISALKFMRFGKCEDHIWKHYNKSDKATCATCGTTSDF